MSLPAQPLDSKSQLRLLVADVEREVAAIDAGPPSPALRKAWAPLVAALALGPEPAVRPCPSCGARCMRAATRCGHCWITLTPPPTAQALVAESPR